MESKEFVCQDSANDAIAYLKKIQAEMNKRGESNDIIVVVREDFNVN